MSMIKQTIIGAGIHGIAHALWLIQCYGCTPKTLRIIDYHDNIIEVWKRNTQACGMQYLRSPMTHNIDVSYHDLYQWAKKNYYGETHFAYPSFRPSLELFNNHIDSLIEKYNLYDYYVKNKIVDVQRVNEHFVLVGETAVYETEYIFLCTGFSENTILPSWFYTIPDAGQAYINHIFSASYRPFTQKRIAIIGAGISGAQAALSYMKNGHEVVFISLEPLKEGRYDFDAGSVGPKKRGLLRGTAEERSMVIEQFRNRGFIPSYVYEPLQENINAGYITHHILADYTIQYNDAQFSIMHDERCIDTVDAVVCTSGFELFTGIEQTIARSLDAPIYTNGMPIIAYDLQWVPRLFACGVLASYQLGPAANNIIGAHLARRCMKKTLDTEKIS